MRPGLPLRSASGQTGKHQVGRMYWLPGVRGCVPGAGGAGAGEYLLLARAPPPANHARLGGSRRNRRTVLWHYRLRPAQRPLANSFARFGISETRAPCRAGHTPHARRDAVKAGPSLRAELTKSGEVVSPYKKNGDVPTSVATHLPRRTREAVVWSRSWAQIPAGAPPSGRRQGS